MYECVSVGSYDMGEGEGEVEGCGWVIGWMVRLYA